MNYELAKELKEAGFPGSYMWQDDGRVIWSGPDRDDPPAPNLQELIGACGQQFEILRLRDKEKDYSENFFPPEWTWCAESKSFWDLMAFGNTPTEAVARLWLALNKK